MRLAGRMQAWLQVQVERTEEEPQAPGKKLGPELASFSLLAFDLFMPNDALKPLLVRWLSPRQALEH